MEVNEDYKIGGPYSGIRWFKRKFSKLLCMSLNLRNLALEIDFHIFSLWVEIDFYFFLI